MFSSIKSYTKPLFITTTVVLFCVFYFFSGSEQTMNSKEKLPLIAIANYGPHASLTSTIEGLKAGLEAEGFVENVQIQYSQADVAFDAALIPQMVNQIKGRSPSVVVALTTPVAQYTKSAIRNTPVVFASITDPVEAKLISDAHASENNITGSSDKQNLKSMLQFAQKIIPNAKKVGLLYSSAEANDAALVRMLKEAASTLQMEVVAIAVDEPRDIPLRMQKFKDAVDILYIGTSGPIQPSLPIIAKEADKLHIPIINVNEAAVIEGMVLASYGVNYFQVGKNTSKLVASLLRGEDIKHLAPIYPKDEDHKGYINLKKLKEANLVIPSSLPNVTFVED